MNINWEINILQALLWHYVGGEILFQDDSSLNPADLAGNCSHSRISIDSKLAT